MALNVTLLGTSYSIPESGDSNYDTNLTAYLKALATAFPQLNGGTQSLTAELDFGVSFGVKAAWFKTETANPASAGQLRLAKSDAIKYRNNANGADLALAIDTADALTFNGANVTGNPMLGATTAAGQSIPNNASTIVVYGTVERDSDAGYNSGTGRYTVPVGKGGDYLVSGSLLFTSALAVPGEIQIFKNAAQTKATHFVNPGAAQTIAINVILNLAAGDVIDLRAFQNSGGPIALSTSAGFNNFAMKRIPT